MKRYLIIAMLLLVATIGFTADRSPHWTKARHDYMYGTNTIDEAYLQETGIKQDAMHGPKDDKGNPICVICGTTKSLQLHHIKPFHLHPQLELDSHNYILVCTSKYAGFNCHLAAAHGSNFKLENPWIVEDAAVLHDMILKYKGYTVLPDEIKKYLSYIKVTVKTWNLDNTYVRPPFNN